MLILLREGSGDGPPASTVLFWLAILREGLGVYDEYFLSYSTKVTVVRSESLRQREHRTGVWTQTSYIIHTYGEHDEAY